MIQGLTTRTAAVMSSPADVALTIVLIGFLVVKELCNATENPRLHILSRYLNVPVVPLLIYFAFILIVRAEQLRW